MYSFTLLDIKEFISKMEKNNLLRMKEAVKYIPFIGIKLYQKALFEQSKIDFLKRNLEKAQNGTILEQQKFIEELTPILLEDQLKEKKKRR